MPITKGHYSSLYKDIRNNKKTETAAIIDASLELLFYFRDKNTQNHLNLEPLKSIRVLLNLKIKGSHVSEEQLEHLFNMCAEAI